ncbi:TPA: sugar phosphate isomerase/epimerase [Candidatus Bathyarchaeota archaeon]|nr:sugar phosphate isomerase/epimerase [Candidatus Bathyarchaeota archaeon]
MKVCLHSISYAGFFYKGNHIPLKEMIPKAAEMGYEGLEIMAKRPLASPLDVKGDVSKEIKEAADSWGIELPLIAAYADFIKPNPLDREKELLYAAECIRLAEELECPIVRFYGGGDIIYEGVPFQKQWELAKESLKYIAKIAADRGITIALEPHTSVVQTHEDALDMVEQIGSNNIGICLDPPLLALHREPVEKAVKAVGKLLLHAHVMDFVRKPVLVKYHAMPGLAISEFTPIQDVPLGSGEVDVAGFIKAAEEVGYEGHLSYEVCVPFHIRHRMPTIKDIDLMTRHAAQYLRKLLGKNR